jgi:hypothetical protein
VNQRGAEEEHIRFDCFEVKNIIQHKTEKYIQCRWEESVRGLIWNKFRNERLTDKDRKGIKETMRSYSHCERKTSRPQGPAPMAIPGVPRLTSREAECWNQMKLEELPMSTIDVQSRPLRCDPERGTCASLVSNQQGEAPGRGDQSSGHGLSCAAIASCHANELGKSTSREALCIDAPTWKFVYTYPLRTKQHAMGLPHH